MKQTKWQRLATIGLCSSLVINAFSGVTAVAETVTIESSPTAESSAKEETQASSVKEETTKASTENSQVTTDTSQEEETKEAEKQVETTVDSKTEEPSNGINPLNKSLQNPPTVSPKAIARISAEVIDFAVVDEENNGVDLTTPITAVRQWVQEGGASGTVDSLQSVRYRTIYAGKNVYFNRLSVPEMTYPDTLSFEYGLRNITITLPKWYKGLSFVKPSSSIYPASFKRRYINNGQSLNGSWETLSNSATGESMTVVSQPNVYQVRHGVAGSTGGTGLSFTAVYRTHSAANEAYTKYNIGPNALTNNYNIIYMYTTKRKVTENFVNTSGAKITPPTGFTQGKQTAITSDPYTFKQAGTLPDTYTTGGKTYKFKGWYKGKTKPATLKTTKTPSYAVTYDDNDDLNVVYEEVVPKTVTVPAVDYLFGFINEKGVYVYDAKLTATITEVSGGTVKNGSAITSVPEGVFQKLTIPSKALTYTETSPVFYGVTKANVQVPKYYKQPTVKPGSYFTGPLGGYPMATIALQNIANGQKSNASVDGSRFDVVPNESAKPNNYLLVSNFWASDTTKTAFSKALSMTTTVNAPSFFTTEDKMFYFLENRRITENFVDSNGTKITPPTGFTQGKQTVIDSDNFTYTSAKALPASYTADRKTYLFQGWYKGSEKPATLETSKTPSYSVTYNDQDDLTAVYKEASISANVTMRGAVDVIDNEAPMEYWEVLLKNTGEVPLTSIKIKPTTDWMSGISTPTELFILGTGQNAKARPITKEQWEAGFEIPLDSSLPVGGQLTINLIGTKVTGQPGQVLKAAVEVTGNFGNLKASDTVRIKDLDQEIKEPTGEGFISVPTFDFGQVGVASATKQHGLKKAADYYGNGTRNPYVRISKTQPNWSLTAQLSQPKSVTDSLPTATRLLLGAAPVSSFSNYNQPTELKNAIGTTNAINLTANNVAISIIANQQFIGSDVYQLDFAFDNIKLEVPANQGMAGQQYQATVTWNLVTGP